MTDHNDTGATARPWSYDIQHGPNGEEIYAWVYYHNLMVCTVKVHHARLIVEAVNAYEPLKARLAEVERELERTQFARDAAGFIGTAAECIEFLNAQNLTAEARIAVLEKALGPIVAVVSDYIERGLDEDDHVIAGRMTRRGDDKDTPPRITFGDLRKIAALAAEQKEAGK